MKLQFRYFRSNPSADKLSDQTPFVFHHIPRSGGTTLRVILKAAGLLTGRRTVSLEGTVYGQYLGEGKAESSSFIESANLSGAPIVFGHIPWNSYSQYLKDPVVSTLIRDPIDRIVSQYKFGLSRNGWSAGTHIQSLIEDGLIVDNTATRMMAGHMNPFETVDEATFELAATNLDTADLVADLKSFDRFCGYLFGALGLPDMVCLISNPSADVLDAQTENEIRSQAEEITSFDKRLYQLVRRRLLLRGKKPRPAKREDSQDHLYLLFPKQDGVGTEVMKVSKSKVSSISDFLRDQFPNQEIEFSVPKSKISNVK